MELPEDNFIALSYINTKLRDEYSSLEELCSALDVSLAYIVERMNKTGYRYNAEANRFE